MFGRQEQRTARLMVHMTPSEHAAVKGEADRHGRSMADYIREAIGEKISREAVLLTGQ